MRDSDDRARNRAPSRPSNSLMKYGMWACCAVMFVPVAIYFAVGGLSAGITGNVLVFAPLLLCVGVHVVMHCVTGKSCHGSTEGEDPVASEAPVRLGRVIAVE